MLTTLLTAMLLAPTAQAGVDWGEPLPVGGGEVRVKYKSKNGAPDTLSLKIQRAALEDLGEPTHGPESVFDLPMPEGLADETAIQMIHMNWNPHGHPPAGMWTVPHFDFHFYMVGWPDLLAITPGDCEGTPLSCDALDLAREPVAPSAMPPGYAAVDAVAPFMGNHLLDLFVNGPTPPRTYIYGQYAGELTFLEPMVTLDYLQGLDDDGDKGCIDVPVPETFAEAGYYPTSYCVYADDDDCDASGDACEVVVSLEAWAWFDATE